MPARDRALVGSRRKGGTPKRELADEGVPAESLESIKAPAGLDISAITSNEIVLSILAEMIAVRRRPERPRPAFRCSRSRLMTAFAVAPPGLHT